MTKKYFEDIADGEPLNCRDLSFTKMEIIEFATQYDPQPFHIDESAADESIFGGLVASSLHTISACTRLRRTGQKKY
jgi:acyl dehydratase